MDEPFKRRCTFCGTGELPDGTVAYVGITACPQCLRGKAARKFRRLLKLEREVRKLKSDLKIRRTQTING